MREDQTEAAHEQSIGSVRKDYTSYRSPAEGLELGGSLDLDRAHVGGAGKRRQRR